MSEMQTEKKEPSVRKASKQNPDQSKGAGQRDPKLSAKPNKER